MTFSDKITVMLVDDSSVIRRAISMMLETNPSIEIVASVPDGQTAISAASRKKPDIIILDVEMPVMDGLKALPELLKRSPDSKVIMCSSLTEKGADITIKAMSLGAVECLVKPSNASGMGDESPFKKKLLELVTSLGAHKTESAQPERSSERSTTQRTSTPAPVKSVTLRKNALDYAGKPDILAIGSSTGGPKALFQVLKDIGTVDVPIVITQHMPATFTKILAEHIGQNTGLDACEAEEGMMVEPKKVYVAPGGKHMLFTKEGTQLKVSINDGPPENFCKPAVDPMMRSLIEIYGKKVLMVVLTGMGNDGLKSGEALVDKGGRVIAQDQQTSVVWGMPGAVANAGLCSAVLPIDKIGGWVRKACGLM